MFGGATLTEGRGRGDDNTPLHDLLRADFEPLYDRATLLLHG